MQMKDYCFKSKFCYSLFAVQVHKPNMQTIILFEPRRCSDLYFKDNADTLKNNFVNDCFSQLFNCVISELMPLG